MNARLTQCERCGALTDRDRHCWYCFCLFERRCIECGDLTGMSDLAHLLTRRCLACVVNQTAHVRPDQTTHVRVDGWRGWYVAGGQLASLATSPTRYGTAGSEVWNGGRQELLGSCHYHSDPPFARCTCGLRLIESLAETAEYWSRPWVREAPVGGMHAIGGVRGEGRCFRGWFEDPRGTWRCETMTITGPIYLSPAASLRPIQAAMEERYGVEVVPSTGSYEEWLTHLHTIEGKTPANQATPWTHKPEHLHFWGEGENSAAGLVIVSPNGNILLVRRGLGTWDIPSSPVATWLATPERPWRAAWRGLKDQLGMRASENFDLVGGHEAPCEECGFQYRTWVVRARQAPARMRRGTKIREVAWHRPEDVPSLDYLDPDLRRSWPALLPIIERATSLAPQESR